MMEIALVENVFTKEEREKMIKYLQPLLVKRPGYPAKQTHPTLHLHPDTNPFIARLSDLTKKVLGSDVEIQKAWAKWSNGKKKQMNWHTHECDFTSVYYLKTNSFLNSGTLFREGFVKASKNDFIVFPGNYEHTTPSHPFGIERYVLSINFMVK